MSAAHAELVKRAARWLLNTRKCRVVATEKSPWYLSQVPDAVGWTREGYALAVECKVSYADFKRDKYKKHTEAGTTVGHERWYLTPAGVLLPEHLAEGVGLIEVHGRQIHIIVPAVCRESSLSERAQIAMLAHIAWHATVGADTRTAMHMGGTIQVAAEEPTP